MTERSSTPSPWTMAADRLAALATRRARIDAFARPAALALAATGALVLVGKATHTLDTTTGWLATALGVIAAIAFGRTRRVVPTSRATAAWALDRLADAHERGMTVALAGNDAARTSDGVELKPPPAVRLRPADGTVLVLVAVMVALAGALWQGPAAGAKPAKSGATSARRAAGSGAADALAAAHRDADARDAGAQATAERRVREALGLAVGSPLDEARVAERLADPQARASALEAAPAGSAAAAALASGDAGAAAALVRALESGAAAEASSLRQEAASLRVRSEGVPIPPARRAVVARYLSSLAPRTDSPRSPEDASPK